MEIFEENLDFAKVFVQSRQFIEIFMVSDYQENAFKSIRKIFTGQDIKSFGAFETPDVLFYILRDNTACLESWEEDEVNQKIEIPEFKIGIKNF